MNDERVAESKIIAESLYTLPYLEHLEAAEWLEIEKRISDTISRIQLPRQELKMPRTPRPIPPTCKASRRDGFPCSAGATVGDYCGWHQVRPTETRCQFIGRKDNQCKSPKRNGEYCSIHWQILFGHRYEHNPLSERYRSNGQSFKCLLCGGEWGYWDVMGNLFYGKVGMQYTAPCPEKIKRSAGPLPAPEASESAHTPPAETSPPHAPASGS